MNTRSDIQFISGDPPIDELFQLFFPPTTSQPAGGLPKTDKTKQKKKKQNAIWCPIANKPRVENTTTRGEKLQSQWSHERSLAHRVLNSFQMILPFPYSLIYSGVFEQRYLGLLNLGKGVGVKSQLNKGKHFDMH